MAALTQLKPEGILKPDFLIVGTMKSGTTSLGKALDIHPKLSVRQKEIHYFDSDANYERGPGWYSNELLTPKISEGVLCGEKTPTYSYLEKVPKRIFESSPEAKLIWVFREPSARAFSNYLHAIMGGAEIRSFEKAIQIERNGQAPSIFHQYLDRSIYVKQVERFLEYFPKESMYFVTFESLVKDPKNELNEIFNFLGVDKLEKSLKLPRENVTTMPRSAMSLWAVRRLFGHRNSIFRFARRLNSLVAKPRPRLKEETRAELKLYFEPYNKSLAELTGLDLSDWS